ncbi:MAG: nucleotidyl transferase AbiEii/AbiGii toxin family protein [Comamonadaceae bacterium]
MNQIYVDTVRLLLAIAPSVFESKNFALKGGTALNLFVQDMPRLSVDIDVVFTDCNLDRDAALAAIALALTQVQAALQARGYRATPLRSRLGDEVKLMVTSDLASVKVEVNFVFRGTVLPVVQMPLALAARSLFATGVTLPVLDAAELYGSKLVAAMDRQHPRDIFDVVKMLEHFGWQSSFVDCFVAYLAGHNRPVHEVLFPKCLPLAATFLSEFQGMTRDEISLIRLEQAQQALIHELPRRLTAGHRDFLLSLVRAEPIWDLMPFENLRALPALKWKLLNLQKLRTSNAKRFALQHSELQERFRDLDHI